MLTFHNSRKYWTIPTPTNVFQNSQKSEGSQKPKRLKGRLKLNWNDSRAGRGGKCNPQLLCGGCGYALEQNISKAVKPSIVLEHENFIQRDIFKKSLIARYDCLCYCEGNKGHCRSKMVDHNRYLPVQVNMKFLSATCSWLHVNCSCQEQGLPLL